LRIVHLRASNFYGGPERQLHFHARLARDTEYAITVASFAPGQSYPEFLRPIAADGIETKVYQSQGAFDPSVLGRIRAHLHERDVDLLCTHDYRSSILGGWAARGTRARWIAFSRGFTAENFKILAYQGLDSLAIRFADHVVAVSRSQKRRLQRLLVPGHRISVVPNAIDVRFVDETPVEDVRARFGWPADSFVVVAGGRFSREKGQIHLVRAAHLAVGAAPRLRFVLFGDGPELPCVRDEIQRLGLTNRAVCPGHERNVLAFVRGADVLVNPSLSEGLPNIVLEGMALKVPVIVTRVGGHPELVEDARTGLLVPPARPRALADAICRLATDEGLASRLAANAFGFVQTHCTFERQFESLCGLYARHGGQ
jgi:glycosyltransferase involved in cell wall biosynthesis